MQWCIKIDLYFPGGEGEELNEWENKVKVNFTINSSMFSYVNQISSARIV